MASYSNHSENYFQDNSGRSPRSMRQPQINRQSSRPYESYAPMSNGPFNGNGMMSGRYDSSRDTFNMGMQNTQLNGSFPYDAGAAQTWNSGPPTHPTNIGIMSMNGAFGPSRSVKPSRGRAGIPEWNDPPRMPQGYPTMDNSRNGGMRHIGDIDEELIPTAIVIKNIPFAVKKEQLIEVMTNMNLPLPYAFNYHFDNGVFRGLAFANFTSPDETERVIQALNHMELSGRKLRVEYKKMLPLAERERIEREKRERRGQLEEQHRPMAGATLHGQVSMSSLASQHHPGTSPSPISMRGKPDVDMNDPQTLQFQNELVLFNNDPTREAYIFPPTLGPNERRIVHTLAHHMGLMHTSHGHGEARQVHICRMGGATKSSPTSASISGAFQGHDTRHTLSRAATTDFGESRHNDASGYQLRGQSSVGMLTAGDSLGYGGTSTLRGAKSYADLRAWTPSPSTSTTFPSAFQSSSSRLAQFDEVSGANQPTLAASASNPGINLPRDENFLISSMGSINLGNGSSNQTSPRRQRSMFSGWEEPQSYPATAPIGSNRNVSTNGDNGSQDRMAVRQPRGPSERGQGFRRQNGRGSDELRSGPPIIVE